MTQAKDSPPSLQTLRAFEAAARLKSFSRAAEELGVTAGAISQHIRAIEAFAGTPLFKRAGRGVALSDAGESSLPHIQTAFDNLSEATRLMREATRAGRVMVSCAPSFAAKWLAPRLEAFQRENPDIEVWISSDPGLVDFHVAQADFAIRYGRGDYEGMKSTKFLEESVLPVCAPALLDTLKLPSDLKQHTLIHDDSPEHDPSCPDWRSWLLAQGVKGVDGLRGTRLNLSSLVIEAAINGRGIALAKRAIADHDLKAGRLVAPFAEGITGINFAYWLVQPKGRHLSKDVRIFIKWLQTQAQGDEYFGV